MTISKRRVRAIVRKEFRDYRRHASIVWAMAIFPLIFLIQPLAIVFVAPVSSDALGQDHLLLYMLAIPVLAPAMLAGFTVAGERQQGTLEPVLTTPVRREEFLLGKAIAVLAPSVAIAYAVFAVFVAFVVIVAQPTVASALLRAPDIAVQVVFTPLFAAWSTWVGISISTRSSDVRVAQQLSLLANLPFLLLTSLIGFDVIPATVGLFLGLGLLLLVLDGLGWRIASAAFDRERLITGTR
jgi:ABC-type transport system involved in multi-copper enzyme maturation permease subunit